MRASSLVCLMALAVGSYGLTESQRNSVLASHNAFRETLVNGNAVSRGGRLMPSGRNIYKLEYSVSLENLAQNWVNRCEFDHSPDSYRNGGANGENMFYTTAHVNAGTALRQASAAWWSDLEKKGFNSKHTTFTMALFRSIGHFTQVAWGANTAVGCGVKWCSTKHFTLVSCVYQKGNILNRKVYEIGEPCERNADCTTYTNSKCEVATGLCYV